MPIRFGKQINHFSLKIYKTNSEKDFISIGLKTKEQAISWYQAFIDLVQSLKRQNVVNKATTSNWSMSRKETTEVSENKIDENSESIFNSSGVPFQESKSNLNVKK